MPATKRTKRVRKAATFYDRTIQLWGKKWYVAQRDVARRKENGERRVTHGEYRKAFHAWEAENGIKHNPIDPIGMLANIGVAVTSALQIDEHMKRQAKKTKPVRRAAAKAVSKTRRNPVTNKKLAGRGNLYMLTISRGDDVESIYLHDGKGDGFSKKFRSLAGARRHARSLKGYKLVENPTGLTKWRIEQYIAKTNPAVRKPKSPRKPNGLLSGVKSAAKRALARGKAKRELGRELRAKAKLNRIKARREKAAARALENPRNHLAAVKGPRARTGRQAGSFQRRHVRALTPAKKKRGAKALSREFRKTARIAGVTSYPSKNPTPARIPRRRTYEMFQGRPATTAKVMPCSSLSPDGLDTLGGLIEMGLGSGEVVKFNPATVKLCAAKGKLWIAGKRFAKRNPTAKTNEINPIIGKDGYEETVDHLVYETFKPHHGDPPDQGYIHMVGEETGHLPTLCVDREGYPVIRGGKYKIEARGIVN